MAETYACKQHLLVIFPCHISVSDEGFLPTSTNQDQKETISVATPSTSIISPTITMPNPSMEVLSGIVSSLCY